ncbi:MAG: hypothetical protein COT17_07235 [Elusimicrobia bacterium CG08_land_8_20_14_0_20_51_18]|nr:MAG: hypothetical protein COT17_07235 [Elusimicrobia bacterium CG08_land_8_20_14_0_20_51_18]
MSFSEITGHSGPISELKKFITGGRIPSSLIFYGDEGVGKFRVAFQCAKAINCSHDREASASLFACASEPGKEQDGDACGSCPSCKQIDKGVHPDVRVIDRFFQANLLDEEVEKQKSLKIDSIREMIKLARSRPILSPKKIFIIDDADTMTIEAQNSILKILEEPAEDNIIILVVSNRNSLLSTILSRCQTVKFNRLSDQEMEKILGSLDIDYAQASSLARLSGGSVKKAMDFRNLISIIREKSQVKELSPFLITSALGRELYEVRANARLLLELLTNDLYGKRFSAGNEKAMQDAAALIRKNLHLIKYLDQNISPKIVCELALIEYSRHYDFDFNTGDRQ